MKYFIRMAALLPAIILAVASLFAQSDTLTIIHINDTHSNLEPFDGGKTGGIARAAAIIKAWKSAEPNPLLVHSGDLSVGTLMYNTYFGVPELQILNTLGFDAMELGNHEFDLGPQNLARMLAAAGPDTGFTMLCTNASNLSAVPELQPFIKSQVIKQKGALRVGLFGLITPSTKITSSPQPIVIDSTIVQEANMAAASLRTQGADIVILLSHCGLSEDRAMAPQMTGIDAIIGGHSHTAMTSVEYVNNIPIVQAGAEYRYVGKLRLIHSAAGTHVLDYQLQPITDAIQADPDIQARIDSLKTGVKAKYTPVFGFDPYRNVSSVDQDFPHNPASLQDPMTPMGLFATYALYRSVPQADCSIEPAGDVAGSLAAGPFTAVDLFRTTPYGYDTTDGLGLRVASFTLTGLQLYLAMSYAATQIEPATGNFDWALEGWRFSYSVQINGGSITVSDIRIGGQPINFFTSYRIASSDRIPYVLKTYFGLSLPDLVIHRKSMVQALLDFARANPVITMDLLGVKETNGERPVSTGLVNNYPNPFNPTTDVGFRMADAGFVTLKVFDLLGQEVATLVNERKAPGEYHVRWDAAGMPSGVYFYRFDAVPVSDPVKRFSQTRRMILAR